MVSDKDGDHHLARQLLDLSPPGCEIENAGQRLPAQAPDDLRFVTGLLQRLVRDAARV